MVGGLGKLFRQYVFIFVLAIIAGATTYIGYILTPLFTNPGTPETYNLAIMFSLLPVLFVLKRYYRSAAFTVCIFTLGGLFYRFYMISTGSLGASAELSSSVVFVWIMYFILVVWSLSNILSVSNEYELLSLLTMLITMYLLFTDYYYLSLPIIFSMLVLERVLGRKVFLHLTLFLVIYILMLLPLSISIIYANTGKQSLVLFGKVEKTVLDEVSPLKPQSLSQIFSQIFSFNYTTNKEVVNISKYLMPSLMFLFDKSLSITIGLIGLSIGIMTTEIYLSYVGKKLEKHLMEKSFKKESVSVYLLKSVVAGIIAWIGGLIGLSLTITAMSSFEIFGYTLGIKNVTGTLLFYGALIMAGIIVLPRTITALINLEELGIEIRRKLLRRIRFEIEELNEFLAKVDNIVRGIASVELTKGLGELKGILDELKQLREDVERAGPFEVLMKKYGNKLDDIVKKIESNKERFVAAFRAYIATSLEKLIQLSRIVSIKPEYIETIEKYRESLKTQKELNKLEEMYTKIKEIVINIAKEISKSWNYAVELYLRLGHGDITKAESVRNRINNINDLLRQVEEGETDPVVLVDTLLLAAPEVKELVEETSEVVKGIVEVIKSTINNIYRYLDEIRYLDPQLSMKIEGLIGVVNDLLINDLSPRKGENLGAMIAYIEKYNKAIEELSKYVESVLILFEKRTQTLTGLNIDGLQSIFPDIYSTRDLLKPAALHDPQKSIEVLVRIISRIADILKMVIYTEAYWIYENTLLEQMKHYTCITVDKLPFPKDVSTKILEIAAHKYYQDFRFDESKGEFCWRLTKK